MPIAEAEEMFNTLRRSVNKTTVVLRYVGENHQLSSPRTHTKNFDVTNAFGGSFGSGGDAQHKMYANLARKRMSGQYISNDKQNCWGEV